MNFGFQSTILKSRAKMKVLLLVLGCVLIAQANVLKPHSTKQWEQFKTEHKKQYNSDVEHDFRFKIFAENLQKIDNHNKKFEEGKTTYKLGLNKYADMLHSEFVEQMLKRTHVTKEDDDVAEKLASVGDLPESVDWRTEGAVTEVKDQGQCGSCWSFSATGTVEGHHFLSTGELVSLSEQNLIDCSYLYGNLGCLGGIEKQALRYIIRNGGIDTEESYPYEAKNGRCRYEPDSSGATISEIKSTKKNDEEDLKTAVVTIGPISVAIDAGEEDFHLYESGIYINDKCSSFLLNHAVLAVDYGADDGQEYWLVKNSWGTSWGEEGYIKMARNHDNMCGIAHEAVYPIV